MMKQIIAGCVIIACCLGCGGDDNKSGDSSASDKSEKKEENSLVTKADYEAGLALIAQSDCLTCHQVDEKVTGPAYRDVANKYPVDTATIGYLADKIIRGGSGVWGNIDMNAHPDLSREDAKIMAKYVLYLKK